MPRVFPSFTPEPPQDPERVKEQLTALVREAQEAIDRDVLAYMPLSLPLPHIPLQVSSIYGDVAVESIRAAEDQRILDALDRVARERK